MKRFARLKQIRRLDPEQDFLAIYRLTTTYEFPWDFTRALELALYRTYAVPSIGRLLAETAELTDRTQKRYDDTALLLDAVVEHGFTGEAAARPSAGSIRCTAATTSATTTCGTCCAPSWWCRNAGSTPTAGAGSPDTRAAAAAAYYRTLGRHMGIKDIPRLLRGVREVPRRLRRRPLRLGRGRAQVSDATLDLMASLVPAPAGSRAADATLALLDDSLLRAFRYERPGAGHPHAGQAAPCGCGPRGAPAAAAPHAALRPPEPGDQGLSPRIRGRRARTFPVPGVRGCPVPHRGDSTAASLE